MKLIALVVLSIAATAASAAGFAERVKAGNAAIQTPAGKGYDASLAPALQGAMRTCAPPDAREPLGAFTLAGTVAASGTLSAVEVRPETAASTCLAQALRQAPLPVPPFAPYPLTIEMQVRR